jgi:hypothetical protein
MILWENNRTYWSHDAKRPRFHPIVRIGRLDREVTKQEFCERQTLLNRESEELFFEIEETVKRDWPLD